MYLLAAKLPKDPGGIVISASISTDPIQYMFDLMEGFSTRCGVTHAGFIPPCKVKGSRKKSKHKGQKVALTDVVMANMSGGGFEGLCRVFTYLGILHKYKP